MGWFKSAIGRATKFAAVDCRTKLLIVQAMILLWLARIALLVAPFRKVNAVFQRISSKRTAVQSRYSVAQITELVERCAAFVPGASCLPQAMTANKLLRSQGYEPTLRIGVARGKNGEFEAHAWVEVQAEAYTSGNETAGRFTALPTAFG